jgi:MFS family permease
LPSGRSNVEDSGAGDAADSVSAVIWGPERRNLTIGLILTVSMGAFEALAVATVLPAAVKDIGGLEWYGWVFSGFMLANLVSITTAGRAADLHGVAQPFVLGTGFFVAGLLGAGLAPAMPLVVASRIAQGLGAGALSSVAYVAIARAYPPGARPRMLAMLSSAWVVPGLVGPALAGAVADHVSWRWVFLGLAPPTTVASALAVPSLRSLGPSTAAASATKHTLTALYLAAGAGAALFGLGRADNLPVAVALLVAGVGLALPALIRLLPAGTLRARRGLPAAVATVGLLGFAFFAAEAFLPLSLTEVRGQSTMVAGVALTAATLTWTAGAWIQARLAGRESRRWLTASGLVLMIGGVAGIALVVTTTLPVAGAAIAWGIAGPWHGHRVLHGDAGRARVGPGRGGGCVIFCGATGLCSWHRCRDRHRRCSCGAGGGIGCLLDTHRRCGGRRQRDRRRSTGAADSLAAACGARIVSGG